MEKVSAILNEDQMVEEKVNRLMKVGFDKTITSQERFLQILAILAEGLESRGDIHTRLDEMNVTTNELVTVAMHEKKLEDSVGACGTVCNNTCEWCEDTNEVAEDHSCATCANQCVSYTSGNDVYWFCESCYSGNEPVEIGLCGFSCDGQCNTCGGSEGYDGSDEV